MKNVKNMIARVAFAAAMILPVLPAAPVQATEPAKTKLMEAVAESVNSAKQEVATVQEETKAKITEENRSFGQKIADAAIAQIGVGQDCTMLVTNSLKAVGINFHGWPAEYASLGDWTNDPQPGDIIIYSGHVAIYIGNDRAIHGGWNGSTTIEYSVQCNNPLVGFIRVRH